MKKSIISLCVLCLIVNSVYASNFSGYDAGALNSQYMKELKFHEAATRNKNKNAIVNQQNEKKAEEQEVQNSDINSVVFVNNNSIPSSILLQVIKDKIHQPMVPENVAAIRKSVMKYYQRQGYYSVVALIVSQNFQTGELVIEVREGGKNSITIEQ